MAGTPLRARAQNAGRHLRRWGGGGGRGVIVRGAERSSPGASHNGTEGGQCMTVLAPGVARDAQGAPPTGASSLPCCRACFEYAPRGGFAQAVMLSRGS